jgi:hypothetical protein
VHLFVYYDVPPDAAQTVCARVIALHAELQPRRARLMKRVDGGTTWMEIYEEVDAAFEATLAAAVARLDIATLTGPRHVERFEDVT